MKTEVVEAVWDLTKPQDEARAREYRKALDIVLAVPDRMSFLRPFYVPKNGGRRLIFAAERELRLVQQVLAGWIVQNFPLGDDYCYFGQRGVLIAVKKHQESRFALVFDLKNAFERVTTQMISRRLKLCQPDLDEQVVTLIVDLLTVKERARQGCVSTPYVYNLVIRPLDDQLKLLMGEFGLSAYTRYVDNACFSSLKPIDFEELGRQVGRLVRGNGFGISWSRTYADEPIIYLGTQIWRGRLSLVEEKYGEFCFRLMEAIETPNPEDYRRQIGSILTWAHHVCGDEIPEDLLALFVRYYERVGKMPPTLQEVLARRQEEIEVEINMTLDPEMEQPRLLMAIRLAAKDLGLRVLMTPHASVRRVVWFSRPDLSVEAVVARFAAIEGVVSVNPAPESFVQAALW